MSKELGKFVTELRKQNHLKQEGLALYAGVSMKFISQLENGKAPYASIRSMMCFGYSVINSARWRWRINTDMSVWIAAATHRGIYRPRQGIK